MDFSPLFTTIKAEIAKKEQSETEKDSRISGWWKHVKSLLTCSLKEAIAEQTPWNWLCACVALFFKEIRSLQWTLTNDLLNPAFWGAGGLGQRFRMDDFAEWTSSFWADFAILWGPFPVSHLCTSSCENENVCLCLGLCCEEEELVVNLHH